ncbi:hypothetical protein [Streptomyces himalayensis]|uniref:Uncharacterized protein n=1 Tax=Streptomyces himalayensis subsp. himalayensis TaxID=2756131 RepID=A0A7W0DJF0_9ACTN|nr:hypothetical protein [Streptomyces himalayensis]MBA2945870.1 hypothetical protein [Streptomyces himalayensis subsp. himalayensis]
MSGYKFDPESAKRVEQGLTAAIRELEETGYFSITAQQGHGFQFMIMSGMEMGSGELADVFGQFCGRWALAIHSKMQDANDIARKLGLSAGLYHEQEEYVLGSLKEAAVTAGSYNPQQGLADGEKAADMSWGEIGDRVKPTFEADPSQPDWGAMGDQWKQVGEDFTTSPWQDVAGPTGQDRSDWQWDGPPPENDQQGGQGNQKDNGGK